LLTFAYENFGPLEFVAIDFETATFAGSSACAVGIVTMNQGAIVDEFYTLIQPPRNEYFYSNIRVHGITPADTENAPTFEELYDEIKRRLLDKKIIAHNEAFDRGVLRKSLEYYQIFEPDLNLQYPWECTVKLYRKKKEGKANLKACCERHDIVLDHHNALSDARACALLYWKHLAPLFA
jgi:DNA polymerase III subunit epsilon